MLKADIRTIVRLVLLLEADASGNPPFVQDSNGVRALKFTGIPNIVAYTAGLNSVERENLRGLLNLKPVAEITQYDQDIIAACSAARVNPALFKALGLMESDLGKNMETGQAGQTAKGFIHMTASTYRPYATKIGARETEMDAIMRDPRKSIPVCAMHLRYLVDKFSTPERVAFSVKNGEYKLSNLAAGLKGDAAQKKVSSALSDSSYTKIALILREMFSTSGPLPVGMKI